MPKVPKIKVFYPSRAARSNDLFYMSKIDQTEGCSETLDHFEFHRFIRFRTWLTISVVYGIRRC
jgi:hypothetical protein